MHDAIDRYQQYLRENRINETNRHCRIGKVAHKAPILIPSIWPSAPMPTFPPNRDWWEGPHCPSVTTPGTGDRLLQPAQWVSALNWNSAPLRIGG